MSQLVNASADQQAEWWVLMQRAINYGWSSTAKADLLQFEEQTLLPSKHIYIQYETPGEWMIYSGIPWSRTSVEDIKLDKLWESTSCQRCPLVVQRHNVGGGQLNPDYMIIGEAPGVGTGARPIFGTGLCDGPTSEIVRESLYNLGILEQCWFTNMIKCPTPGNRKITLKEYSTCANYLQDEFDILKPKFAIVMGKAAFNQLENRDVSARIVPVLHPAFFLRSKQGAEDYLWHVKKQMLWDEVKYEV